MSSADLRSLLDDVPDTFEIVLRRVPEWSPVLDAWRDAREEAAEAFACWLDAWRDAREEAAEAFACWRDVPGGAAYAAYRAAQDREDAAQDALSQL